MAAFCLYWLLYRPATNGGNNKYYNQLSPPVQQMKKSSARFR